ncbi:hypothetical protein F5Y14DRAFT_61715 [Nemania sp. NC0429]|nr:hypothetical protein F5Y14DRAFT_61715 [Nemania sp. NC0429]
MATGSRGPRTVADATRFTANTPHANAKSTPATSARSSGSPNVSSTSSSSPSSSAPSLSSSSASSSSPPSSPASPSSASSHAIPRRAGASVGVGRGGPGTPIHQETMEERVRRLRAAHLAAKQHSVSRMDRVIDNSRRVFDAAHKFTVMGLIGFSGIALLVTVYATADMMMHNRKRRNEFFALQKQLHEDSLEAARLAYMTGTATEQQIALVEDATARAKETGVALPSILSVPQRAAPAAGRESTPESEAGAGNTEGAEGPKAGGITGWLFGGLKKEEVSDDDAVLSPADDRWRTTSTNAAASATATATTSSPTDDVAGALRDKAKVAFEQERENQQNGGPLDQLGQKPATPRADTEGKKKGWLW